MNTARTILIVIGLLCALNSARAQEPKQVEKTNPMPVYMHYMPWFDTPETSGNGKWGWHWTMNNKNPDIIINAATAKREIASHFYPLVGPYASNDPDIIEYHLLLMKYAGIDGILIDWYGEQGTNPDIGNLLRNSNAIVDQTKNIGLQFGVVLEDRFAATLDDAKANVEYLKEDYFNRSNYIMHGDSNDPLLAVFGPISFEQPDQWSEILAVVNDGVEFLPLWNESPDAGTNADGEYAWVWENESLDNYFENLEGYYKSRAPQLKTVMGVAYPGFTDFYKEGNAGNGYFNIPHEDGATLNKTLNLANQYKANMNMLQLATWNDFGEGTMIEPTYETGFDYLERIQEFTGVSYGSSELLLIYKLFQLRKANKQDPARTELLDQAAAFLTDLSVPEAREILDTLEPVTGVDKNQPHELSISAYPNPVKQNILNIKISGRIKESRLKLTIYNLLGTLIKEQEIRKVTQQISIPVDNLEKGVYIINLGLTDKVVATRFVVLD